MEKSFTPQGSIVALVTPLKKTGEIDEEKLRELVNWQIESGTNGIVPVGTTGESATLTHVEHRRVVSIVIAEAKKRVPVIAGAGSNSTKEAIELARYAQEAGADAILSISPYYNKPMPDGMFAHFAAIAKIGLPIILYNVPSRTGKNIEIDTVIKLAANPNIVGIKEASCDLNRIMEILRKKPNNFAVLSGEDSWTLALVGLGANGAIGVTPNEMPREFSEMIALGLEKKCDQALKIHNRLLPLMNANFLETNPIPVKTALALMGKIDFNVRLPLSPMQTTNKVELEKIMRDLKLIQ